MKQKQKALRRSLWASVLAIVFCVAMLLGTTFAWFTDTVSSTGNKIQSGTLEIQLNNGTETKLFAGDGILWEPGFSQTANATVSNVGTLWLKYAIQVTNMDDPDGLAGVLDVYISKSETEPSSIEGMDWIGTVADLANGTVNLTDNKDFGILAPAGKTETVDGVEYKDSAPLYLVIKMKETAGNEYQNLTLNFDIEIAATQYTKETDGFENDQYDADAPLEFTPVSSSQELKAVLNAGGNAILTKDINNLSKIKIKNDVTIDLDGHTLKGITTSNKDTLVVEGANVTVTNGTVEAPAVKATGASALFAVGDSTVTIENCTLKTNSNQSYAVVTNGFESLDTTIVIRNSTISAPTVAGKKGYAAYIPAGNVTFENCDVTGHIFISGGDVTLDGGTYTATGFNNQSQIWDKTATIDYAKNKIIGDGAFNMGDSIFVADRRDGYTLSGLTIRNITFNTEIPAGTAYAIKYVDLNKNGAASRVAYDIGNNKFNQQIDGADPVMFIDLDGNDIQ